MLALYTTKLKQCRTRASKKVLKTLAMPLLWQSYWHTYIDETRKDENITVFKLADLYKLYSTRFEQLGGEQHDHLHSTCLNNRILANFPDLTAHKEGHDVVLAFNNDLGAALYRSFDHDYDDEAIV